ncbi:MAG: hypothetical protein A2898_01790 [Candidatus Kerfeldbacteria bacterium RIFCSPLOWO2_01_FULL_48_11]|uniref:PKD/Chitinase domain-containing protein n=1 Tax=Candidatus Kerfeldbacteria bacterium RIFCSPLOWO2_01_FULL_48_11 TaxID=1798543 RepID=A0A1G2B5J9_9BACT|nr:MAG: Surface layer protein [Parcubacteria group bacterium GW2011_GWA2_48_9]KKW14900.1 MAG: Surface layer protein [Parcubacteria group bacterium GW2011_GWC2_49_9]OGY83986.1 MAG: hypothetical protein A2898_01790 [Candidatus Kerfeldbacteria bacterium RIFCSPLOWO2_01_FULL_48_11]HCJ52648.1 hypothetical protein [Candidatus Kerfeldbacteria bacterium]HCM67561.1 hypothetical protein [Candidatus Kerfeldbacteria bacterium]
MRTILVLSICAVFCAGLFVGCGEENPFIDQANVTAPVDSMSAGVNAAASPNTQLQATSAGIAMQLLSLKINGLSQNVATAMPAVKIRQGDRVELRITFNDAGGQTAMYAIDALGAICSYIALPQYASGPQTITYTTQSTGTGVLHIRFLLGESNFIVRFFVDGPTWTNADVEGLKGPIEQALAAEGMPGTVLSVKIMNSNDPTKPLGTYHPPSTPGFVNVSSVSDVNESNCEAILFGAQMEQGNLPWTNGGSTITNPPSLYAYPQGVIDRARQICQEKRKHSTDFLTNVISAIEEDAKDVVHVGAYIVVGGACIAAPELVVPCAVLVVMAKADAAAVVTQAAAQTVINAHYQKLGWTPEYRDLVLKATTLSTIFGPKSKIPNFWDRRLAEESKHASAAKMVKDYWGKAKHVVTGLEVTNVTIVNGFIVGDFIDDDVSIAIPIPNPTPQQNSSPNACFTVTPQNPTTSDLVKLSSCASDFETPVPDLQVRWQFNGSWTAWSVNKSVDWQWQTPGTYTVIMEVRDGGGLISQASKSIIVTAPPNTAPTACFTYTPQAVTTATTITLYSSCSSDRETVSSSLQVRWSIDGIWYPWTTTKTRTKLWTTAGTKTVILQVRDTGGLISQTTKTITVTTAPVPKAYITVCPGTGTTGQPVSATFTAENAQQIRVTWGDQSSPQTFTFSGQAIRVDHTFIAANFYTINCSAYGSGVWSSGVSCLVNITNPVVNTPPIPCLAVTPQSASGTTSTMFLFDAQCSSDQQTPATALLVRFFINGAWTSFTTSKGLSTTWPVPGTYTVIVEVKDQGGLTAQTSKTVTVSNAFTPMAILNTSIPGGNLLSDYSVIITGSGGTNGYGYGWSISSTPPGMTFRSNADRTATLSGVPGAQGNYTFTVTVTDMGTPTNTASKTFTLVVGPAINRPPVLNLTSSTASGVIGSPVTVPWNLSDAETPFSQLWVAMDWQNNGIVTYVQGKSSASCAYPAASTYDARFTAWDGTDWSPTQICRITVTSGCSNMPTLLDPTNNQTVSLSAGFTFSWTKVCESVGEYNLYVMTAPNSSGAYVFADRISPTWTSLRYWGTGLQPNTTYYWCLQMGSYYGAPLTPFGTFRTAP